MKKYLILVPAFLFLLTSCGGGWSSAEKEELKKGCEMMEMFDCECFVNKTIEKYKSAADMKAAAESKDMGDMDAYKDCIKK